MRLTGIREGDLVLVRDQRDDTYLALVRGTASRALDVMPLDGRDRQTITGHWLVAHYKRRTDKPELVERAALSVVNRSRRRHGVTAGPPLVERVTR